ncbi:hypothetical protein [Streptomyces violascens]
MIPLRAFDVRPDGQKPPPPENRKYTLNTSTITIANPGPSPGDH